MAQDLILAGVVHRDPAGLPRLAALLEELSPKAVALELAEPSVALRRERGAALRQKMAAALAEVGQGALAEALERGERLGGGVGELAAALELPYEFAGAEAYCRHTGAPLELLGDPEAARLAVARLEDELLTAEHLRALLESEARAGIEGSSAGEQYALARSYLGKAQLFRYHFSAAEAAALEAQAGAAAPRLEALLTRGGPVLYLAGWEQLIDGGLRTVYPRFKERARRVLLCDAKLSAGPAH